MQVAVFRGGSWGVRLRSGYEKWVLMALQGGEGRGWM